MKKYIIGIDEVGRGALAGRVVVAAVLIPANLKIKNLNKLNLPFRDSKKLSPRQRELWLEQIKNNPAVKMAVAGVTAPTIDKINIAAAANRAAGRAFKKLIFEHQPQNCRVFLDGGLYIFNEEKIREKIKLISVRAAGWKSETVIRGDEKIPAVKLASIVAKVMRDRQMVRLHKKYPRYGFDIHKGYGTKKHFEAIRRHGPSEIHRLTFLKNCHKIRK
ncbi:MAG: ribonuclease HII [bacterium]|nr:ribonuclease HII [bacterium]